MEPQNQGQNVPLNPPPMGAPPPGYGAPPPGYGAPPPGYQAPPPGYGAPPPGYGAPPPPGVQGATTVVVQNQANNAVLVERAVPCCPSSNVDVSETSGMVILILNILTCNWGTLISSCMDRNGCNCDAFLIGLCQGLTFPLLFLGYVWAILHGIAVYENSKGKM